MQVEIVSEKAEISQQEDISITVSDWQPECKVEESPLKFNIDQTFTTSIKKAELSIDHSNAYHLQSNSIENLQVITQSLKGKYLF